MIAKGFHETVGGEVRKSEDTDHLVKKRIFCVITIFMDLRL